MNLKVPHLACNKQFSSVIEDVEMEAQTSPLRKKKTQRSIISSHIAGPSFQLQSNLKKTIRSSSSFSNEMPLGEKSKHEVEITQESQLTH